ncbi:hypothetical protein [Mucisphaera calidilacus]|uniref:hypothetical protein n=1 Tax=Mucisphaera calidilacus TaxID=2527982 RepID=UPI0011A453D9|nr:hypothetical protein [Mucisphaera calidilacus]
MSITVRSPHSGVPVTVRTEDVGRALRDESGRVFYVVAKSEGEGHYGSRVRGGSEADEARSAGWDAGEALPAVAEGGEGGVVHDARGVQRRSGVGVWVVVLVVVAGLAAGGWWLWRSGVLAGGEAEPVGDVPAAEVSP